MSLIERVWNVYTQQTDMILDALWQHIYIAFSAIIIASIICIPLGIYLTRHQKAGSIVIGIVSVIYTIPSLAMFGLLLPILGIGVKPALVALTVYAMLPILRNVYTGILGVDKNIIDAGQGMGMTSMQVLFSVELPLSLPVIMAGLRTAATMAVATTTISAFIGAGGLGSIIYRGVNLMRDEYTIAGAIPTALLALVVDRLLLGAEKLVSRKTYRKSKNSKNSIAKQIFPNTERKAAIGK